LFCQKSQPLLGNTNVPGGLAPLHEREEEKKTTKNISKSNSAEKKGAETFCRCVGQRNSSPAQISPLGGQPERVPVHDGLKNTR